MKKLNVVIIGQGRSGRDIHGNYFKKLGTELYNVIAVVDRDARRRERALSEYPGCEVFESYQELYDRKDIDLVVNSTISDEHFQVAKDLIENGFNVLVEKPFARTRYECDALIRLAKEKDVKLGVFQQTFLTPYYMKSQEVIASGKLGEIKQVDITFSGFSRRWDWQCAQVTMGGNIYNTGPHPIGLALGYLDFDKNSRVAFSRLAHVLSSGDSDDYSKIILTAPDKPVIDLEINNNDAYPANTIKILGSRGTYTSTFGKYEMKYIVDGENPEKPLVLTPYEDENGYPAYCSENLITHEESGEFEGDFVEIATSNYYQDMYGYLTEGKALRVTPEIAASIISVIETVHAENPLEVKF